MADLEEPTADASNSTGTDADAAPDASQAPDYEALLAEEREKLTALQGELSSAKDTANARMTQLEGLVSAAFQRPATPEAPAEPEISDEDLLSNPGLARQVAQKEAAKLVQANNAQVAQVMQGLVERSFTAEFEAVKARNPEIYEVIKDDIDKYFASNPQAKLQPGAANEVYKYYVGEAYTSGKLGASAPAPQRLSASGGRTTPPAPDGPRDEPEPERKLSGEQARLAGIYGMEDKDWFEFEDNPDYHKHERGKK